MKVDISNTTYFCMSSFCRKTCTQQAPYISIQWIQYSLYSDFEVSTQCKWVLFQRQHEPQKTEKKWKKNKTKPTENHRSLMYCVQCSIMNCCAFKQTAKKLVLSVCPVFVFVLPTVLFILFIFSLYIQIHAYNRLFMGYR